ncbi:MAG: undecaprenyl/decaprenyl-phosphate alpha-N-acetylglucosaminyl 1-phosphate transferase [Oscillospiraceae bacterium]|nr:undecaprenyl/decaprenyl-phosphate alpha-N-acetylglucosaminyl 1-phosphate transferase [Oscillospiraceae bacterium]MBQ1743021.1 undecaprenyl/decaprenyl-phosphate alpha-N-acetylglucosaminyl 1-phosphate transferase [Oscillospiraceae bacterium]MBQ2223707.1 undecaprenyl/decaprenyl-phosphate alpha-N-acetylglucosaminyl 1-phosphate transferase [Oscillospiraceae bacterium]
MISKDLLIFVGGAVLCAMIVSYLMCPLVKSFAYKIGAIDVPKDNRRMHKKPTPRLGGLAIFLGFIVSILLFVNIDHQMQGILLGAVTIVVLGVVDDMSPLRAGFKFLVQIVAALIAVFHGVVIHTLSNPNVFSAEQYWDLGWLAIPVTVLWIVGITNSVNLIDGLDGLANGVSTISALTLLVIALLVSESQVALVMAALVGACIGFMPYNRNPAKMFMGDTGSTFLGYILATISIQGLFKYYAIVSFVVPFLVLGLPMFDTLFAIIRRLAHGQNPMAPDRGHIHHRLIDMGLNQKQAVAALYVVSSILGLSAVVLTASDAIKAMLFLLTLVVVAYIAARVIFPREIAHSMQKAEESAAKPAETAETASGEEQPMLSRKAAEGEHTVQVKEVVKIEDAEKNGGEQ